MAKVPRQPDPKCLAGVAPQWFRLAPGYLLWRIYFRGGAHPSQWNQFRSFGPTDARFDHHIGKGGTQSVLYLAKNPITCIAEVFQKTRTIHCGKSNPALVGFKLQSSLKLLDLTGAFTTRIGASMGLPTGSRATSRNWARGLYAAYPKAQGIAYPSSMYQNALAFALNEHAIGALPSSPSCQWALNDVSIITILNNAAELLNYALINAESITASETGGRPIFAGSPHLK